MSEYYNPCIGCEYYNKPYWNIINPCDNCPKICVTNGCVTTNIKVEKSNDSTTNLPTAKEYREAAQKSAFQFTSQWSEPIYQCPECGGGMCKNLMVTLTTYPVQYEYQCDKCGHKEYQFI